MIHGLSGVRQFPRLGIIKKGVIITSEKGKRPAEVDYFVCPEDVQAVFGEKPKRLQIILPSNDWGAVFPHAYKLYRSDKVMCMGDGKTATRNRKLLTPEQVNTLHPDRHPDKDQFEVDCTCELLNAAPAMKCKPSGILSFMLPDISVNGVFQIFTHSIADIVAINSAIASPSEENAAGWLWTKYQGRIAGRPLILEREEYAVTFEGKRNKHWKIVIKDAVTGLVLDAPKQEPEPIRELSEPITVKAKPESPADFQSAMPTKRSEAIQDIVDAVSEALGAGIRFEAIMQVLGGCGFTVVLQDGITPQACVRDTLREGALNQKNYRCVMDALRNLVEAKAVANP